MYKRYINSIIIIIIIIIIRCLSKNISLAESFQLRNPYSQLNVNSDGLKIAGMDNWV